MNNSDNNREIQRQLDKQWHKRLRLYSQKKRRMQDEGKFDEKAHQKLIKEFRV